MKHRVRSPVVAWVGLACAAALVAGVLATDACSSPTRSAGATVGEAAPSRARRDAEAAIGLQAPGDRARSAPIQTSDVAAGSLADDDVATFDHMPDGAPDPAVEPPSLARGRVAGIVLDPAGVAVPGAVVYLVPRDEGDLQRHTGFEVLTADDEGAFHRDGVVVGRYELYCNMGETGDLGIFEPALVRWPRGFVIVDVAPDQETSATIRLQILPQLMGRVTGAGVPVEGALVTVMRPSPWHDDAPPPPPRPGTEPEIGWTDERGLYSLTLDRPGEIQLVARSDCSRVADAPRLTLVWGDVARQDFEMHAGRISGVVRDAQSALGIADASVEVHGDHRDCSVETDADGGFAVSWLAPGTYVVEPGHRDYCPSEPIVVELTAGGTVDGLDFSLHRGGSVSGVVSCADGSPVPGEVTVSLSPLGRPDDGHGEDATDRYEFRGLDSGTYELFVEQQRVGDYLVHAPKATLVVVRGESVIVDLVLRLAHSPQAD